MSRIEFNTLFRLIKLKLLDDLFSLFNTLACYNTKRLNKVV